MIFFNCLIFPGLLFSAAAGLMAGWVDRKLTARIQYRIGPPWHQNFTDIVKLLGKEVIVPPQAGALFLLAPFLGLLGAGLSNVFLVNSILASQKGFGADLVLIIYLLTMPALALMLGASSSGNPLAAVGASREMKLVLAYELPFILSIATVIIKCGGTFQLGQILSYQGIFGSCVASLSGFLAFCAALFCMQAKLGLAPFDISEADQEIMGGVLVEYSGAALALFRLTKALMLYTIPVFLIVLFLGKDTSILFMVAKYAALLVFIIVVKNTNPRLRIDQAMRFFWGPVTIVAAAAVVLALFGK